MDERTKQRFEDLDATVARLQADDDSVVPRLEELEVRERALDGRVAHIETRLTNMERAIGQLGAAYIAFGGASKFAADQARTMHLHMETPEIREAFEATLAGLEAELEHYGRRQKAAAVVLGVEGPEKTGGE